MALRASLMDSRDYRMTRLAVKSSLRFRRRLLEVRGYNLRRREKNDSALLFIFIFFLGGGVWGGVGWVQLGW